MGMPVCTRVWDTCCSIVAGLECGGGGVMARFTALYPHIVPCINGGHADAGGLHS